MDPQLRTEEKSTDVIAARYLQNNERLRDALQISPTAFLDPQPLGMGEHNLNYRFSAPDGRIFVLRINVTKQPFHENQVRYEYNALRALECSGCTPRALFLDDTPDAPGEGVLVISFCEGDELDFDALRPGDLACAAKMMADVHAQAIPEDAPLLRPHDPLRTLFEECVGRCQIYENSPVCDEHVMRYVHHFADSCQDAMERYRFNASDARIVNTETLPSHFLIPASTAQAASQGIASASFPEHPGYFVDWERPIIGDIAEDLAFFISPTTTFWDSDTLFPAEDVDAFLDMYWCAADGRVPDAGFTLRFAAFRRMAAFRAIAWCLRAEALYAKDSALHRTSKAMAKVPRYLSDEFLDLLLKECF